MNQSPNGGNKAPVITSLSDIYARTDAATIKKIFTVTDNAGDIVTVTIPYKPGFVVLQNTGGTELQDNCKCYNRQYWLDSLLK